LAGLIIHLGGHPAVAVLPSEALDPAPDHVPEEDWDPPESTLHVSGAYKSPRELTWVLGVTLLILMVATAFTGGCIRWDQSGYFDTVVGTTIAGWTPIIGPFLAKLWRGGDTITPLTMTRTFAFHG